MKYSVKKEIIDNDLRGVIKEMCESLECQYICDILTIVDWQKERAAEVLGMTRTSLNQKIKKCGLKKM